MRNLVNRQWRMKSRPLGMVGHKDFEWKEEPVGEIGTDQALVRNLYLSFDPTQRSWMAGQTYLPPVRRGEVMRAFGVGQVVKSQNPRFKPGQFVSGLLGWQDYYLLDKGLESSVSTVPPGIPLPMFMSVLGITGLTAYFGMLDIAKLKPGDNVVVSGAAGATGSIAAQIAKIKGARVIGIAGGPEKCNWLLDDLKLDGVIDYKSEKLSPRLNELLPEGVDVYFDNVGGETLDTILTHLRLRARIVLCGAISEYNTVRPQHGLKNYMRLIIQRGKMEGFIILDYVDRFESAAKDLMEWVKEGKIKYQIDLQKGLEAAPETLKRLFTGMNRGKQLLKIADAPLGGEVLQN